MKKITIITVCYNSAATIRDTIDSVLAQDYPNKEYIIVDGLSSDGTQDIVLSYKDQITKFVSGPDEGLYDAMNKAISLSTGDVIAILNSDDIYASTDTLSIVMRTFDTYQTESVFGDLYYFKTENPEKPIRHFKGKYFKKSWIKFGILPPHPAFFVNANVYRKYGNFDLSYKYASDFDLMARFLYVHSISYKYVPRVFVKMRIGGISTSGFNRMIEINKEDLRSCKKNGIRTNIFLFHLKYLIKLFDVRNPFHLFKKQ